MFRSDRRPLRMAAAAILLARTISISAQTIERSSTAAEDRFLAQNQARTMATVAGNSMNPCGCLPPPPTFDMPPPPPMMPNFEFSREWLSDAHLFEPILNSNSVNTCHDEFEKRLRNFVREDGTPSSLMPVEDGGVENDLPTSIQPSDSGRFFDQPFNILIAVIAAGCMVLVLMAFLAACYWRKKSSGTPGCNLLSGLHKNQKSGIDVHQAHLSSSSSSVNTNDRSQKRNRSRHFHGLVGASNCNTLASKIDYCQSINCDPQMINSENIYCKSMDDCDRQAVAPTEWSYNSMKTMHPRSNAGVSIANMPTPPPLVLVKMDDGPVLQRVFPPPPPPPMPRNGPPPYAPIAAARPMQSQRKRSSEWHPARAHYDNHNPVYEEISLHNESTDRACNGNDSGASSANSDIMLHLADYDDGDEYDENGPLHFSQRLRNRDQYRAKVQSQPPCPDRARPGDPGCSQAVATQLSMASPGGSSECESGVSPCDCSACVDSKPMQKESSYDQRRLADASPSTVHVTPSPVRNKLLSKINRSTQSEESCLPEDFCNGAGSNNCYECSGRESGYGTEGSRQKKYDQVNRSPRFRNGNENDNRFCTWHDTKNGNSGGKEKRRQQKQQPVSKFHTAVKQQQTAATISPSRRRGGECVTSTVLVANSPVANSQDSAFV